MFIRPKPINEEIMLDPKEIIISKTDSKGIITYANDYFIKVVGYSKDELLGKPHNIIRHPDMPRIVFKLMWDRINKAQPIKALVKNLAKDGRYYWVLANFETNVDPITKEVVTHTAYRTAAPRNAIKVIEKIYAEMLKIEDEGGMDGSEKFLNTFLHSKNMTYDEFMETLVANKEEKKGFFSKLFG